MGLSWSLDSGAVTSVMTLLTLIWQGVVFLVLLPLEMLVNVAESRVATLHCRL